MPRGLRDTDFGVGFETALEALADIASRIGLVIAGGAWGLLLYHCISGAIYQVQAADMERAVGVVRLVGNAWLSASLVVAILWAIRRSDKSEEQAGYVLVYGLLVWFGMPYLVRELGTTKQPVGWANPAVNLLLTYTRWVGPYTLATLIWPAVRGAWGKVRARAEMKASQAYKAAAKLKRESPKSAGKPNVLSPCWRLPYCRDYLLAVCPAYKARRRCWKFKRGCFCDPSMLENMVTGVKGASVGQQAYMRAEIEARQSVAQQRSNRPPCKRCFIYLEHEELKYNVLAPMVYPFTVAALYFGFTPVVKPAWQWVQQNLAALWGRLALSPDAVAAITGVDDVLGNNVIAVMIAIILGFWLVLFLLRLIELWCFKWKL